ncbi:MAG TPA: vWA domain-containing protein [Labilithrix sp.]|nr:vWA domain-containing protein [Labilithrix sp.]
MARLAVFAAGSLVLAGVLASVGCGTENGSTFGDQSSGDVPGANPLNGQLGSSGGPGGSSGSSGASSGQVGAVGGVDPSSACATSSAGVDAPPIYLVFMVDRSGSMGNSNQAGQNLNLRWNPVKAGLQAFFADPANANVHASITFFSQGTTSAVECSDATYSTPAVAMTALPDATQFTAAFGAQSPGGGTPTKPAENGAIAYAQTVQAGLKPGEKVAIVLATDGEPNDCTSTPDNVAAAAATVASTIPTYVIGVGPDTTNLDKIAVGGGTTKAIMIATANAAQVSADLRAAIGKIKAAQLGCTYTLPPPPAGQTLDVNAVNVDYTPAGGPPQTLAYSADCSNPNGWHYDSATAPTQIVMCANSCSTLQADTTGGKVDIIFGCAIAANPGDPLPGGGVK